jgi:hypothetical protein
MATWQEYEAGAPRDINESLAALVTEVVRLRTRVHGLIVIAQEGGGGGKPETQTPTKPQEPQDAAESPDTGPWLDNRNFKAKIRAIRTDANGKYQGTTLQAQEDYLKNGKKDDIMVLRNKNWESEFKRAQNAGKLICLRMSGDGKVQSIEVLD